MERWPRSLPRGWLAPGVPCFVPFLLLGLWLGSSILSPPLASFLPAVTCVPGCIPAFEIKLLFFKKYFYVSASDLLLMCLALCPWPWLWLIGKCSSRTGHYYLECSDSYSPGTTMTSYVLSQQWYFLFLSYLYTCALYFLLTCYLSSSACSGEQGLYNEENHE